MKHAMSCHVYLLEGRTYGQKRHTHCILLYIHIVATTVLYTVYYILLKRQNSAVKITKH